VTELGRPEPGWRRHSTSPVADALSTLAQLAAAKRIEFLLLTVGLVRYLSGIVLKSSEARPR
jgi:hypothetical protein